LTDEPLNGYLDKVRRNIQALDESIESTRKAPEGEKVAERRARLKLLRDLIELENVTLTGVKSHLLGRDETGAPGEPVGTWDYNSQVMFERSFHYLLTPWTLDLLKLKCQDCGIESEEVSHHNFQEIRDSHYNTIVRAEDADLCPKCVEKRKAVRQEKAKKRLGSASDPSEAKSERSLTETSNRPGGVLVDSVQSTVNAITSENHPPTEKIRMLEEYKAKLCKIADERGLSHLLGSSLMLIDKEIQRLKAELGG